MGKNNLLLYLLLLSGFWFSSCASYKMKIDAPSDTIEDISEYDYYKLYLIGDAGNAPMGQSTLVLDHLENELSQEGANSSIVWLGDNIYPVGLAPESHKDYPLGKHRILAQCRSMDEYKGRIFFIPGNHDWYNYGSAGVKRQEILIENYLDQRHGEQDYFLPKDGCGDPILVELDNGINLLLMDTHWYFASAKKSNTDHCNCKDKDDFRTQLSALIEENGNNSLVVCQHHPSFTYGSHGGRLTVKDHIFPLTQVEPYLWIPLPIFGSFINKLRNYVTPQDMQHPQARKLKNHLVEELNTLDKESIIASGHDHNLQLIQREGHHFVVSGAGSKMTPTGNGKGRVFSAGQKGYVRILFKNPNDAVIQFLSPTTKNEAAVVYQKKINLNQKSNKN